MTENDIKWLAAAGATEVEIPVADLSGAALWWAFEVALHARTEDMKIDDAGHFLIALSDDANPPGWYHYRKRADSDESARAQVAAKLGQLVKVPIKAALSAQPIGIW